MEQSLPSTILACCSSYSMSRSFNMMLQASTFRAVFRHPIVAFSPRPIPSTAAASISIASSVPVCGCCGARAALLACGGRSRLGPPGRVCQDLALCTGAFFMRMPQKP